MGDFTVNRVNLLDPRSRAAISEVIKKSSAEVWHAFEAYMAINTNDHSAKVLLVKKFPFEEYSSRDLQEIVLTDNHIASCEVCQSHVFGRRKLYLTKSRDINLSNCIQLRKLAIEYDDETWKRKIDDFIAENFTEACKQLGNDVIKSFSADDILKFVRTATRSCTKAEFAGIINWVRADTQRHSLFPELLEDEGQPGLFKTSLRSLCELENESILSSLGKYLRSSEQKPNWVVTEDNFGFVRYLTQQYDCDVTQKQVDRFICDNLSELADKPDVGSLPFDAIKNYAKDETFYQDGTTRGSIWILIKNWIKQQGHIYTKDELSEILASVQLGKLSYEVLREYSKHDVVRESSVCQANLIEVILTNSSAVQNSHILLKKQVSDAYEKFEKLEATVTKVSDSDASRNKAFAELKTDVNSKLGKTAESLNLCQGLSKRVENMEQLSSQLQLLENRIQKLEAFASPLKQQSLSTNETGTLFSDRLAVIENRVRNLEAILPEAAMEDKSEETRGIGKA